MRNQAEMAVLQQRGARTAIFELQGSLFFGTADQLYLALEPEFTRCDYLVLDMRRVQSVDSTAAHMLELIEDMMTDHSGMVIFSHMPSQAPSGQDMVNYFKQVGLARRERHARIFPHLDAALEWIENRILEQAHIERPAEKPWDLRELEVLRERKQETIAALEASTVVRSYRAGETIFRSEEQGDALYFIRTGSVRILMPLAGRTAHHLSTFGRGDVFGEISFIDRAPRSADAVADYDTEVYVLSRAAFDRLLKEHEKLGINLLDWIAKVMANRLRRTNTEVRYLKES
jgi:SulP family sulfate permease